MKRDLTNQELLDRYIHAVKMMLPPDKMEDIGAEVDNKPGNRVGVKLNGHFAAFRHAHRDLPKEEVVQVRKFLETCGVTPAKFPL